MYRAMCRQPLTFVWAEVSTCASLQLCRAPAFHHVCYGLNATYVCHASVPALQLLQFTQGFFWRFDLCVVDALALASATKSRATTGHTECLQSHSLDNQAVVLQLRDAL
jgi:hypothetical protein